MHHEQDMRYYGALRKQIPLTFWAMMAGTLAITGVGIVGVAGFAGFYSKDAILEAAFASGTELGGFAFWAGITAALLTSFYSWRLMFLTFWGKPRWIQSEHIQHSVHKTPEQAGEDQTGGYHPHESPWTMLVPLGVLSIGAIAAGYVFHHYYVDEAAFWAGAVAFNEHLAHAMHEVPTWVKWAPFAVMLTGLVIAWYGYIRDTGFPARFVAQFEAVHSFLFNKWYFDELYDFLFVRPAFRIGQWFWKLGDVGIIDRFGPDGAAWAVARGAGYAQKLQSGYLYSYALVMLLGLVGAISWAIAG
jgi:NADH-quinone oxidoreductase subunit L